MDPNQPAHRYQFLYLYYSLWANSMDPDQTAQMRRLVWIHAGRKRTMLVLAQLCKNFNEKEYPNWRRTLPTLNFYSNLGPVGYEFNINNKHNVTTWHINVYVK
jgi:hypothetical protein